MFASDQGNPLQISNSKHTASGEKFLGAAVAGFWSAQVLASQSLLYSAYSAKKG
jgi:hypothetical protein